MDRSHISAFLAGRWFKAAFLAALAIIAVVAYWSVLRDAFVCDDYYLMGIDRVPVIADAAGESISSGSLPVLTWLVHALHPFFLRPVVLSAWLALSRAFGTDPLPYHLTSTLLHAMNAWLLFWLLKRLKASNTTAILPALLFLLSPVAPEVVSWSAGYFDLFSLLFILLSLCLYSFFLERGGARGRGAGTGGDGGAGRAGTGVRNGRAGRDGKGAGAGRRRLFYAGSLISMSLALFSKEMALTLIAAIPLMDLLFSGMLGAAGAGEANPASITAHNDRTTTGIERGMRVKHTLRRVTIRTLPFAAVYTAYLAMRYLFLGRIYESGYFSQPDFRTGLLTTLRTMLAPFSNQFFSSRFIMASFFFMLILVVMAVSFILANWRRVEPLKRRLAVFFAVLITISLMPAEGSVLHGISNNMLNTRVLYTATAFSLGLLAIGLFEFAGNARLVMRAAAVGLVIMMPLYFWGLHENNIEWRWNAAVDTSILVEMHQLLPDPPAGAHIYLLEDGKMPQAGLNWCSPMLEPAVRLDYGRYDIRVQQQITDWDAPPIPDDDADGYYFTFDEATDEMTLSHGPRQEGGSLQRGSRG